MIHAPRAFQQLPSLSAWLLALVVFRTILEAATSPVLVSVDFSKPQDIPLLKKYAIYNSGIISQERYTPDILKSMGVIKASSFRADLSIGKSQTGFYRLVDGNYGNQDQLTFNFSLINTLAQGLHDNKVAPYWSLTYNPVPFQPLCEGGTNSSACFGSSSTCLGFENQSAEPGTNNYTCLPFGSVSYDDCWKCPPKDDDGNGYQSWNQVAAYFHNYFVQAGIQPQYEEHWNEPDLTEFYNPTVSSFKGSSQDLIDMYQAASQGMENADPDVLFGGPALAKQIVHNPDYPDQPNGEDLVAAVASLDMPMQFFSFHSIVTCEGCDQIELFYERAQQAREVLSNNETSSGTQGRLNTTEIHCSEFFPNSTTNTLTTEYAASAHLATVLLDTWLRFLEQTDVTMVHWAQYMDIFNNTDQIGLIDFSGNVRPAWWAFRWWADIPVERVQLELDTPYVRGVAGFSLRECYGGILLWSVPAPQDGSNATAVSVTVRIYSVPFRTFTVQAFLIDDKHKPKGDFLHSPVIAWANQTLQADGSYVFPPSPYMSVMVPVNGTIYLRIAPVGGCSLPQGNGINALPTADTIQPHYYFGLRPRVTTLYGHFHLATWTGYLGMGQEPIGYAIAGATIRASTANPGSSQATVFNISMNLLDGTISLGGIVGLRVDFFSAFTAGYPVSSSYFFYQGGSKPCYDPKELASQQQAAAEAAAEEAAQSPNAIGSQGIIALAPTRPLADLPPEKLQAAGRRLLQAPQAGNSSCGVGAAYPQIPNLWGSKQPVPPANFIPVQLSNFLLTPKTLAPPRWDGKMVLLFVLKDGTPGSKVQAYVTRQPGTA